MCKIDSVSISGTAYVMQMKLGMHIKHIKCMSYISVLFGYFAFRGRKLTYATICPNFSVEALSKTILPSFFKLCVIVSFHDHCQCIARVHLCADF